MALINRIASYVESIYAKRENIYKNEYTIDYFKLIFNNKKLDLVLSFSD